MSSNSNESVRAHYRRAVGGFAALTARFGQADWDKPALGPWTVRDLVGHTSRALATVESYLDTDRITQDPSLRDAVAYFEAASAALADPAAVAERGRQAGAALGDQPAAAVAAMAERVVSLVEASEDNALVTTPAGTMALAGYLPTRTFELVVHSLDLTRATGADFPSAFTEPLGACLQLAMALAEGRNAGADVLLAMTGRRPLPSGFSVV